MASWIESHTVTGRHRKIKAMSAELRIKSVYLVGHLHVLWHAALEQQENGDLSSWSDEMIASYSEFDGDAPQYVSLLQRHRLLDGKLIHDWLDYAGRYLMNKYATSDREKLIEIWAKHGRTYGSNRKATEKQQKENNTVPDPPYPPDQPNQPDPLFGAARSSPTGVGGKGVSSIEGDELIYQAYPRKVGKMAALKAIKAARGRLHKAGNAHPGVFLLERTKAYAAARQTLCGAIVGQKRYTPNPATWFNQGRYDDDVGEWSIVYGAGGKQDQRKLEIDAALANVKGDDDELRRIEGNGKTDIGPVPVDNRGTSRIPLRALAGAAEVDCGGRDQDAPSEP